MPATESMIAATDPLAEPPSFETVQPSPDQGSKPMRNLLVGFAATVGIGLSLAVWYLTSRIVKADEVTPAASSRAMVSHVGEMQAAVVPSSPSAEENSLGEAYWYTVPPPAPSYLEIASLGPKADTDFVNSLHARGFQAEIRSGRTGESRLLVGPFFSAAELERAKSKLEARGVLATEVTHVLDR